MKTITQFLRDLSLASIAMLLFCCLLEFGLRATGQHLEATFYLPDSQLGYTSRPNFRGWNVWEQLNFVQINSVGMHDREHVVQRDPSVIRIAVLGDSLTEAKELPMEQNYCSVLERELNAALAGRGKRAEVLNFAVGGYDLAQDYFLLEQRVWQFDPQVVILANMTGIAVRRSTRKLYVGPIEYGTPFFVLKNGNLMLDDQTLRERASFPHQSKLRRTMADLISEYRLLDLVHSSLAQVKQNVGELGAMALGPKANKKDADEEFAGLGTYAKVLRVEQGIDASGHLTQADTDLIDAWNVTEATFQQTRNLVAAHHAQLFIFTLDWSFQVDPDPKLRQAFLDRFGLKNLFGADENLARFAAKAAIPIGVLGPDLVSYAEKHHTVLHGFPGGTERNSGHYNAAGHYAVGHFMAQKLLKEMPAFHGGLADPGTTAKNSGPRIDQPR